MPEKPNQDKTEPATPKKKEDARKKGQVAVSREIPSVMILFMTTGVFFFIGGQMFVSLAEFMRDALKNGLLLDLHTMSVTRMMSVVLEKIVRIMLPLLIGILLTGIAANIAQFGILFTVKPLTPKFSKLNPLKGLKRLFSLRSVVEVAKALLKVLIISLVAYAAGL